LNPAVTVAMATHRGFEWYKVLPYCAGQFIGALLGSAATYCVFYDAIVWKDDVGSDQFFTDTTAGIFCTFPAEWLTTRGAIIDNLAGTAALLLGLCAISDAKNFNPIAGNLAPLAIGFLLVSIIMSTATNAGAAINPVRDFPQRLFLSFAGWGPDIFSKHDSYWWVPAVIPFLGAQLGIITYDLAVGVHHDQANAALKGAQTADGEDPDVLLAAMAASDDEAGAAGLTAAALAAQGGGGALSRSASALSSATGWSSAAAQPRVEGVNLNAVGGKDSAALRAPSGMVHVNQAFLDERIKQSADNVFHRGRKAKAQTMGAAALQHAVNQQAAAGSVGMQPINMHEPLLPHDNQL